MKYEFPVLFLLIVLLGLGLSGSYLWMQSQVRKAGGRLGLGFFHPDYDKLLLRKYQEIARTAGLPMWPVYLYWVGLFGTIILVVGLIYAIKK